MKKIIHRDENARTYIKSKLKKLARVHGISIVMAVESGSRLWGFPSSDSDYDVRFIYTRPIRDYLSVRPMRDFVESPIEYDSVLGVPLDMNGWDIKKAIVLAERSNRALIEWAQSPITYIKTPIYKKFCNYVRASADLNSIFDHYIGWTKKIWRDINEMPNTKNYCYAIRSALSADYISRYIRVAPPDIQSLLESRPDARSLQPFLDKLLTEKTAGVETSRVERIAIFDSIIESALNMKKPIIPSTVLPTEMADNLFREAIGCC